MTIINLATPLEVLFTVPIYIVVRFLPANKGKRMKGCVMAFLIWLFVTMGFLPFATIALPGTIELFSIILLIMLTDIGMQYRALTEESSI
ncbi:MAG: hypothetical protein ACXADC_01955 [Candidatus Thorarchaeota archaeon]